MDEKPPFNPLDKANLGRAIVEALLASQAKGLDDVPGFLGAGIYAIYYRGPFEAYGPLSPRNKEASTWPIYVGKAIPKGGRKRGRGRCIAGVQRLVRTASKAPSLHPVGALAGDRGFLLSLLGGGRRLDFAG